MSQEVLSNFTRRETILALAEGIDLDLKTKSSLKKATKKLASAVDEIGAEKLLLILTKKALVGIAVSAGLKLPVKNVTDDKDKKAVAKLDVGEKGHFAVDEKTVKYAVQNKGTVTKAIKHAIADSADAFAFFDELETPALAKICEDVDDIEDAGQFDRKDLLEGIKENVINCGLTHLFGAFTVSELKGFVEERELTVKTNSKETIIDCLIEGRNFKPKKSKKKPEKRSDKKPELEAGVKRVDLHYYFKRQDLVDYCRENELLLSGTKNELVNRILAFHKGDVKSTKPKEKGRRSKSRS